MVMKNKKMWLLFAVLSAVFAAATSILAKVGVSGVDSNLATAVRTVVVLLMAWGMVFLTGGQSGLHAITPKAWTFLVLSGLATGASWLCYFYALKQGQTSKVVAVDKSSLLLTLLFAVLFLGEACTWKSIVGVLLILVGTLLVVL